MVLQWRRWIQKSLYGCRLCENAGVYRYEVCEECFARLDLLSGDGCVIGRQISSGGGTDDLVQINSVFYYGGLVKQMIIKLKYEEGFWVLPILGEALAYRISVCGLDNYVLMPMPMHRRRRYERGYNQAILLAKWVSNRLGIAVVSDGLWRVKNVLQQGLGRRERLVNVRQSFLAKKVTDCRVVLLDDVVTTGSTLYYAHQALYEAGYRDVHLWTLAVSD